MNHLIGEDSTYDNIADNPVNLAHYTKIMSLINDNDESPKAAYSI